MEQTCPTSEQPRDQSSRKSISLVLPAWNEAAAICRAVTEADLALRKLKVAYEIIVVDDGSSDETAQLVEQIAAQNPAVHLVRHEINQGYGAALRTGFAASQCDLIVFTDSDSQFDLNELDRFMLLARTYQIVCGYRIDRKDPLLRCFYSRVYNQLVRLMLGTKVRDVDCAMKMFHREVIQGLPITTDGFLVNSELLSEANRQKISIVEVGVSHRPRTEGSSSVSIAHIPVVLTSLLRYWWNRVQFAGINNQRNHAEDNQSGKLLWCQTLLIILAATVLFTNLDYPLFDRDETRYAEIPREMLFTGNWIMPQLNFQPYYDKPVLLYWLCAISYSMLGVSAWSARIVPAIFGLATLMATLWFGNRMIGKRASLLAATALFLSVGFLGGSRALLIDGVLTFFTSISCFASYEAVRRRPLHLGWWMVASTACGLAFLTKGPIAVVLLAPPLYAFTWLTETASKPTGKHWLGMSVIIGLIVAPWFIAVSLKVPYFVYEFFYRHNVARFAGAFHQQPSWYFIPILMIAGFPWSLLTVPFAGHLCSSSFQAHARRSSTLGYLLLWSAWCFLFFSLSRCKLPPYILPAIPTLALAFGYYLDLILFSNDEGWHLRLARQVSPWLASGTICLLGIGLATTAMVLGYENSRVMWLAICFWTVLMLLTITLYWINNSARVAWSSCALLSLILACHTLYHQVPQIAHARRVFKDQFELVGGNHSLEQLPIVTVGREWSEIPFHLKRNDIFNCRGLSSPELCRFVSEHSQMLLIVKREHSLDEIEHYLPQQIHLRTVAESGHARFVMVSRSSHSLQETAQRKTSRF